MKFITTHRFSSDHKNHVLRNKIGMTINGPGINRREVIITDEEAAKLRDDLDRILTRGPIWESSTIQPVMVPRSCGLANTWDIYVDDIKVLDGEPFAVADAVRRALTGDKDVSGWCLNLAKDIQEKVVAMRASKSA